MRQRDLRGLAKATERIVVQAAPVSSRLRQPQPALAPQNARQLRVWGDDRQRLGSRQQG